MEVIHDATTEIKEALDVYLGAITKLAEIEMNSIQKDMENLINVINNKVG